MLSSAMGSNGTTYLRESQMRKAIEQYKKGLEAILISDEKEYLYERRLGMYTAKQQLRLDEKLRILQELNDLTAWLKRNEAQ